MITRDKYGIIVQQPSMDGGDSAARMGLYALTDDKDLSLFKEPETGLLVRHPFQEMWNTSRKTSRDQLVQFCVSDNTAPKEIALRYCKKWFINKDFLSPAVRLYLYKRADLKVPLWLKALGYTEMLLSLVWNTKIKPQEEMNQYACMCIVYGPWFSKQFIKWHPDIYLNISSYWDGWRDQAEVGDILRKALYTKAAQDE